MDVESAALDELLATYRHILRELRVRGVAGDDEQPTAGYAEILAAAHYRGSRQTSDDRWDCVTGDGRRVLVRALIAPITGEGAGRRLPAVRSWDFDLLLVVLFDGSYGMARATEIPVSLAEAAASFAPSSNGYVLHATDEFLDEAGTDITEALTIGG